MMRAAGSRLAALVAAVKVASVTSVDRATDAVSDPSQRLGPPRRRRPSQGRRRRDICPIGYADLVGAGGRMWELRFGKLADPVRGLLSGAFQHASRHRY